MPSRECLAEVFKDTLAYITEEQELQNSIIKSIEDTKFYDFSTKIPVDDNHSQEKCVVTVAKNRTFAEVIELREKYRCEKIAVLNFASPTTPGGGVVAGSRAQEESLCRCSTLYPVLETDELWEKYYSYNRSNYSFKATDACIYTPGIKIIKSDVDVPERLPSDAWVTVDVITCAAPNLVRADYHVSNDELMNLHINRGRRIFDVALNNGVKVLVLGAFGCGAFKNNPYVVSKAYQLLVEEYKHHFKHISFAIFCTEREKNNYNAFVRVFEKSNLINAIFEDLDELGQQENDEIVQHFKAIKGIIKKKCARCDRGQWCLGCIFSSGEMIHHIDEGLKMMELLRYRK